MQYFKETKFNWVLVCVLALSFLSGCSPKSDPSVAALNNRITQLEKMKPGLGEQMSALQLHHAKLWFAGTRQNWKLANYELGEIKETIEFIKSVNSDRKEVSKIPMIEPVINQLEQNIDQQNTLGLEQNFKILTQTCNACHTANHFEFNVITIPTSPPVPNQDFSPHK